MSVGLRGVPSIEPARAANFFSRAISLVDVHSDHERRAVRIPCAAHIPLPQLRRRIDEILTDRPVALVCRSGHRSALAALIARRHGLEAMSVTGGMSAWLSTGGPAVWPPEPTLERQLHEPGKSRGAKGSSSRWRGPPMSTGTDALKLERLPRRKQVRK